MVGTLWKLANAINEGFSIIPHSKPTPPTKNQLLNIYQHTIAKNNS